MKKILSVVLLALALSGCSLITSSNGQHTGYITAIHQEGIFFPNYRVYVKTDLSSSQEDIYCMHRSNTDLANTLRKASVDKTRVTVTYSYRTGFTIQDCSEDFITGVQEVK